jgi:phosphomannomutase
MFVRAVTASLQSVGCDVVDLGMVPTPTLLLAVRDQDAAGGIGVTASHNPAEWNALKLVSGEGLFLDAEGAARFRAYLAEEDPVRASWDEVGAVRQDPGTWSRHLERLLELPFVDVEAVRARRLPVAVDCVHGVGGPMVGELLETLGCSVHGIGMVQDGRFPRDPEPTAANLADLGRLVRDTGAVVGFAVDPDADRLSLVDEAGNALGEDLTLALAAAVVLGRTPGPVVANLSTSQVVEDVARAYDARLVRAPVGEVNVARCMQAEGAVVGGEGNGGVILPALNHTRDALLAVALILQHLVDEDVTPGGRSLSEVVGRWPSYRILKEKASFPKESLQNAYEALDEDLSAEERDDSDGLRLAWPKRRSWLHVRPSGTEPIVRLIAEAPGEEGARALLRRAAEVLDGLA